MNPYPKNAKKHPDAQLKQIALSLKEYGWRQPIVTDKNDEIIVGHGRWMAYQKYPEGIKEPWIVKADDLTPEQVRGYRLMDNKTNESDWDMALAIEELKELDSLGFDIELTGFDKDLLIEPDDKDDIIPTDAPGRAKLGDIWLLGEHRVMCGDSSDKASVERLMEGKKADMVFTDPPYNIGYSGSPDKEWNIIENDEMTDEGFNTLLTEAFARYRDSIKTGGGMYVFHSPKTQDMFANAIKSNGFEIKSQLIWNKPSQVPGMGAYRSKHEPFYYACVAGEKADFYGDRTHTSVWDFQKTDRELLNWAKLQKLAETNGKTTIWTMKRANINEYVHPTQKPVELVQYAICNSSKVEDIVLDLFLGSGSTLIAAEKTGRICYGMEISPAYVDVILKRWEDYTHKEAILYGG